MGGPVNKRNQFKKPTLIEKDPEEISGGIKKLSRTLATAELVDKKRAQVLFKVGEETNTPPEVLKKILFRKP